jgi:class 3 adenylate cyclase/tetratricopeptide (TPR) repeat protein
MLVCPQCGRENPSDFRFCSGCGAALAAEPGAEVRKTVTVLFCDLVGSTSLGDQSDPEVLRQTMSRYHSELRGILERHGGTVEKFVGDAAMAVFGIPQVHEDDALRAVRAAVEIGDAVAGLALEVRIGLNTGEVVAGEGETLVTGDAVNVAARLEQTAKAGEILLGEQTERLIHDAVRAEAVEPLELKGKVEPVPAYRLLELLPDVPAFTRPIEAPFVGREQELQQLERALRTATEQRQPQLATVVGPPGIGKSRLVRELIQRSDARVLVGRCLSYGEGITYWPLAEIASQLEVRSVLAEDELAFARIEAALDEGAASSDEIAWGFRRLFEALGQEHPLIVVLDDIHWAEPTLLDLIEYIAAFAQEAPLLLLCTARPDLFDLRPAWATPKPNATLLTLEPLAGEQAEALVSELGEVAPATKAQIVEAAEGNPLFVEQLVAMQAESGNGKLEIPPTIQALLAARIDRLEPEERTVIERASIEGRLFHRGSVQKLVPEPVGAEVGGHLLTLMRKEFIRPDRATVPGDDGFRFGHILIRDAAYDSIPKRLRAELHERFAGWLDEKLDGEAPDEILGYHLEQAYRYGAELDRPDDSLGKHAAERLNSAGRTALARGDVRAAVKLFGRAVELVPEGDVLLPRLLLDLGQASTLAGDKRAAELFDRAGAQAKADGDRHVERLTRLAHAGLRMMQEPEGGAQAAVRQAEEAIAEAKDLEDHEVLARAWYLMSQAHLMWAEGAKQARALELAVKHARQTGDSALEIEIVARSAPPLAFGPVPVDDGFRWVEDVVARLGEEPTIQLFATHVLGHLRARRGEFELARREIDEWRSQFRELGQESMYASGAVCVWDVCSLAQDWESGFRALEEAYALLEGMGEKGFRSTVAANLAEAHYRLGRPDEAERYSRVSEKLGSSDDRVTQAGWRAVRAKVLASRGELEEAVALADEAFSIMAETDALDTFAGVLLDQAEVLRAAGRAEDARVAVEEAVALYEQKGNLIGMEKAKALL